jgi:hypothetical protein
VEAGLSTGTEAIAGEIARIVEAINRARAEAGGAAAQAGETVLTIGDRATPERVQGRLTVVSGQLDTMRASLVTAIERLQAAHGAVSAALHGQTRPLVCEKILGDIQYRKALPWRST